MTAVNEWVRGAMAFALLRAGLESGLLDALQKAQTPADVSGAFNMDEITAHALLRALAVLGLVERQDDRYILSSGSAALLAPGAPTSLHSSIASYSVMVRTVTRSAAPATLLGPLSGADMLAVGRGVWGQAESPAARNSYRGVFAAMPEVTACWERGARHIELGCGAGRNLLQVLLVFLNVHAVGIDLERDLLADVQRQAQAIGVADRLELRCSDARELHDNAAFDTVEWSQMFFPPDSHAAMLRVCARLVRASGFLIVPLMPKAVEGDELPPGPDSELPAILRLVLTTWGIAPRPRDQLKQAAEAVGFRAPSHRSPPTHRLHAAREVLGSLRRR